jgi:hypothetical protein
VHVRWSVAAIYKVSNGAGGSGGGTPPDASAIAGGSGGGTPPVPKTLAIAVYTDQTISSTQQQRIPSSLSNIAAVMMQFSAAPYANMSTTIDSRKIILVSNLDI